MSTEQETFKNLSLELAGYSEYWDYKDYASLQAAIKNGYSNLTALEVLPRIITECISPEQAATRAMALAILNLPVSLNWTVGNNICHEWLVTRDKDLGELIKRHKLVHAQNLRELALFLLQTDQHSPLQDQHLSTMMLKEFATIAATEKDVELQAKGKAVLADVMERQPEFIAYTWFHFRQVVLLKLLKEHNFYSENETINFWLAVFIPEREKEITQSDNYAVELLLQSDKSKSKTVKLRLLKLIERLENPKQQSALCELISRGNYPEAQEIAIRENWQPLDLEERALFFFVTRQWDKYDALDFDRRLLRAVYQKADKNMRQRLAALVREVGRVDYLTILTSEKSGETKKDLTPEESDILIRTLIARQSWAQLSELLNVVSFAQSIEAAQALLKADRESDLPNLPLASRQMVLEGLAPSAEVVREQTIALCEKAVTCLNLEQLKVKVSKDNQKIKAVVFSPKRPLLAIIAKRNLIVLWNTQTAQVEQVIAAKIERALGFVAFTESDILCWGEQSTTHTSSKLYRWWEGKQQELGSHEATITDLKAVGGDLIVSSGYEGKIVLWDAKNGGKQAEHQNEEAFDSMNQWPRSLAVSNSKKYLAVLDLRLSLLQLPDLKLVSREFFTQQKTATKAAFAANDKILVLLNKNKPLRSGKIDPDERGEDSAFEDEDTLEKWSEKTKQISQYQPDVLSLPRLNLIVLVTKNNVISLVDTTDKKIIAQLKLPESSSEVAPKVASKGSSTVPETCLTQITLSADGFYLAAATTGGKIYIYDLRPFFVQQLFSLPLAQVDENWLDVLYFLRKNRVELNQSDLSIALDYIETVVKHRLRYEIEVDEVVTVRAGNFDIELDENM